MSTNLYENECELWDVKIWNIVLYILDVHRRISLFAFVLINHRVEKRTKLLRLERILHATECKSFENLIHRVFRWKFHQKQMMKSNFHLNTKKDDFIESTVKWLKERKNSHRSKFGMKFVRFSRIFQILVNVHLLHEWIVRISKYSFLFCSCEFVSLRLYLIRDSVRICNGFSLNERYVCQHSNAWSANASFFDHALPTQLNKTQKTYENEGVSVDFVRWHNQIFTYIMMAPDEDYWAYLYLIQWNHWSKELRIKFGRRYENEIG